MQLLKETNVRWLTNEGANWCAFSSPTAGRFVSKQTTLRQLRIFSKFPILEMGPFQTNALCTVESAACTIQPSAPVHTFGSRAYNNKTRASSLIIEYADLDFLPTHANFAGERSNQLALSGNRWRVSGAVDSISSDSDRRC